VARGIGFAVAQGYAEAGAAALALIHSSAKTAALANLRADELRTSWPATRVAVHACDVSDPVAIEATTNRVAAAFGRLDVVVVNAGLYSDARALDMSPEEAQKVTAVNYFGALYTAQAAARVMRANGTPGKIIFTASIKSAPAVLPVPRTDTCPVAAIWSCASSASRSTAQPRRP
jgi:sorbose reductase